MSEKMIVLSVRVPEELLNAFEEKVKRERKRVPDTVRLLIAEYVKSNGEKKESSS